MKETAEQAYHRTENLLRCLAWKFCQKYPIEYEEAFSVACLAFARAYNSYDPSRGATFGTWCYFRASMALKSLIMRESTRATKEISLEINEELCGAVEQEATSLQLLLSELPEDVRTLFNLFAQAPREVLEQFRLLLQHPPADGRRTRKARQWMHQQRLELVALQKLQQSLLQLIR